MRNVTSFLEIPCDTLFLGVGKPRSRFSPLKERSIPNRNVNAFGRFGSLCKTRKSTLSLWNSRLLALAAMIDLREAVFDVALIPERREFRGHMAWNTGASPEAVAQVILGEMMLCLWSVIGRNTTAANCVICIIAKGQLR